MNPHARQRNRDRIAAALLADATQSDRQLALILEVDRATVRRVRAALEKAREIPKVKIVLGDDGKRRRVFFDRRQGAAADDDQDDDGLSFSPAELEWLTDQPQADANRFEAFMLNARALYRAPEYDRAEELIRRGLQAQLIDQPRTDELHAWLQRGVARAALFRGDARTAARLGYSREDHQAELAAIWDRSMPQPDDGAKRRSRSRRGRRG